MSELQEALAIAAALPNLQKQALDRLLPLLKRQTINDLWLLADALEHNPPHKAGSFQSANGALAVSIMTQLGVKVRIAEWEIRDGRCEHKQYRVGSTTRARIG